MTHPLQQSFGLQLDAQLPPVPLAHAPAGPFWQLPGVSASDYADGLEELIADYNRQPAASLGEWARAHPLTPDERFVLEYNTSTDRANVLRPLPLAPGHRVLEIGCGCGPVSQYLWSQACTLSVDAAPLRARAAAARLARQPNPHGSALLCADFHRLDGEARFDWVIINGVLEYAALNAGTSVASPYLAFLQNAARFLRPGGRCVITIENQFGLKYFAGAPEDHYGRTAVGVEGYHSLTQERPPIRTFSRSLLARLGQDAGLADPVFFHPFPDYKFAKVIVPDDPASWEFAAQRLLEPSPAWRGTRAYTVDEPAVFRSAAGAGLAGELAHSFLLLLAKPGPAPLPLPPPLIHYYPLRRTAGDAQGAVFDLSKQHIHRRRLDGRPVDCPPGSRRSPASLPLARIDFPVPEAGGLATTQPIAQSPTLWETLRSHLSAGVDVPAVHHAALADWLRTTQERYLRALPAAQGDWQNFLGKLRQILTAAGVVDVAQPALHFLENQSEFAHASLAQSALPAWCPWAPDWIWENLTPEASGAGLRLFDVEYLDDAACLPAPALAFRALRVLHSKLSHPALATRWPWPAEEFQLEASTVTLPAPLVRWTAEAYWPTLPPPVADRHIWFWSKVGELIECAMTATVVAPLIMAYETRPWAERLSEELKSCAAPDLNRIPVRHRILTPQSDTLAPSPQSDAALITKEQEIARLAAAAEERLQHILAADAQLKKCVATETELRQRLAELEAQKQQLAAEATRLRHNPPRHTLWPRFAREAAQRWSLRLAEKTACLLGKAEQYPPRPLRRERFPRPPRLSKWPRLCMITPSYQQAHFLEATMRSVLDQGYPNLAYGVQDGGSTDGSAAIIEKYIGRLSHAASERDDGQADAIRRGFAKLYPTHEDIMAWLNSDDLLMPGALHYVGAYFARHPEVDVIYGHRVLINDAGQEIGRWFLPPHAPHTLPWFDLVPQETLFWRARCFDRVGGMDPSFHFAMDWDLLLRFEQAGLNIVRLPYFLGCFRVHAAQKTSAKIATLGEEEMQRLRRRTHGREVHFSEVQKHLEIETRRSAMTEWLHRKGLRF